MEWSGWTDCSLSCGSGEQSRSRVCTGPFYGGQDCDGNFQENRTCNDHHCPGNHCSALHTHNGNPYYRLLTIQFLCLKLTDYGIHGALGRNVTSHVEAEIRHVSARA